MKYIIFFILLALIGGFIYWRLRPYIKAAQHVLDIVRGIRVQRVGEARHPADLGRTATRESATSAAAAAASSGGKLVRCQSCDTWFPASRAVTLGSSASAYCSHACLERAADQPRRTRKSAS